ncbi:hypothetical protein LEP1GSC170_4133 [Leptospira interrogans serovar Bataviae str. HAI135]|nr:hypothetical protein LEP1GSC170_4133 [Leptospira interrogans serovar Bataviae str. HAI135]
MEKQIRKRLDRVKEKGHQRLTVLLIPHGFDKSFHFQISVFTIFFFLVFWFPFWESLFSEL